MEFVSVPKYLIDNLREWVRVVDDHVVLEGDDLTEQQANDMGWLYDKAGALIDFVDGEFILSQPPHE